MAVFRNGAKTVAPKHVFVCMENAHTKGQNVKEEEKAEIAERRRRRRKAVYSEIGRVVFRKHIRG